MVQVKKDTKTGLSKGFGFVRFNQYEDQTKVICKRHSIGGRWCDVRIPLSREGGFNYQNSEFNRKIFVGRLTEDVTVEDLREYFGKYGEIADVFIPKPFRAFAFVTFHESDTAQGLCGEDHIIKSVSVHVSNAVPKVDLGMNGPHGGGGPYGGGPPHGGGMGGMNGSQGGYPSGYGASSRYSHQPSYYTSYDSRRSSGGGRGGGPNSQYHSSGPGPYSSNNHSPQHWSSAGGQSGGDSGRHGGFNSAPGGSSQSAYGMGGLNINSQTALQLAAAALAGQAGMSLFGNQDENGHNGRGNSGNLGVTSP